MSDFIGNLTYNEQNSSILTYVLTEHIRTLVTDNKEIKNSLVLAPHEQMTRYESLWKNGGKISINATYRATYDAITSTFNKLGIDTFHEHSMRDMKSIRVGDVLEIIDGYGPQQKTYFTLVIDCSSTSLITFPTMKDNITPSVFYRPELGASVMSEVENHFTIIEHTKTKLSIEHSYIDAEIKERTLIKHDGLLQIGDIKFIVDPTQLSFMTQNGYQFFPTIRTSGNPQILTMQEVKSINLVLIFPNQDSINNQLIPLLAMYRRAPFVTMFNNDVCSFFKEIVPKDSNFLPVVLEGIHLQSVKGFPSTIQATLTILPFDHASFTEHFKAVKRLSDITAQQWYATDRSNEKMEDNLSSVLNEVEGSSKIKYYVEPEIKTTDNFEYSVPFKVLYQSMIKDWNYIRDDSGNEIIVDNLKIPLEDFRPNKSLYKTYKADAQNKIGFEYSYINGDIVNFSEKMSDARMAAQEKIKNNMIRTRDIMFDKKELAKDITLRFTTRRDVYDNLQRIWHDPYTLLDKYLTSYGLDVTHKNINKINGLLSAATTYLLSNTWGKSSLFFGKRAWSEFKREFNIPVDISLELDHDLNGMTDNDGNSLSGDRFMEMICGELVKLMEKEIAENKSDTAITEKFQKFFAGLFSVFDTGEDIFLDPNSTEFHLSQIPMTKEYIKIDNNENVVTGWSVTFSNKLVPVYLQGRKYPYYQHTGSDDFGVSLNIFAIENNSSISLKNQLSLLNDRLYSTAKIISLNSPELLSYTDARLHITVPDGHIFDALGIKKAIYNNSNVSNVSGKPGSWDIVLNLTQSNMTLSDYQNVYQLNDLSDTEDYIMNILLRTRYDRKDGKFKVFRYVLHPDKMMNNITDVKSVSAEKSSTVPVIIGSFDDPNRDPKIQSIAEMNRMIMAINISNSLTYQVSTNKLLSESVDLPINYTVFADSVNLYSDPDATAKLETLSNSSENTKDIILNMLSRIDDINNMELEKVLNIFQMFKKGPVEGLLDKFFGIRESTKGKVIDGVAGLAALMLLSSIVFTPIGGVVVTGIAIGGVINYIDTKVSRSARETLASTLNNSIGYIFASIKSDLIKGFTRDIIKDNIIRKVFFGETLEEEVNKSRDVTGVNCYNDFDIPTFWKKGYSFGMDKKSRFAGTMFSPDMYLYNYKLSTITKEKFLRNSISRMTSVGKLITSLTLHEYDNLYKKFESIQDIVYSHKNQDLKKKICSDLTISNVNVNEIDADSFLNDRITELQKYYASLVSSLENNNINPDKLKVNLISVARTNKVLDLMIAQAAIDDVLNQSSGSTLAGNGKNNKDTEKISSMLSQNSTVIKRLSATISEFFDKNYNSLNTIGDSTVDPKKLKDYSSLPAINQFEINVYQIITSIIKMSSALADYHKTNNIEVFKSLDTIPEVAMLDWWNWRAAEDKQRELSLINDYRNTDDSSTAGTTSKLFPTFKIMFMEEDRGVLRSFDDYYTYDAIQSIEIVENKYSAGKTAVIRLANTVGRLTNKLALLRELGNPVEKLTNRNDNIFSGSLDIKPGAKILIKLGYAANDRLLKTKFIGRVIEMNPGPVTEIICQSYGAQLNTEITQREIGMLSSIRGRGDIASFILDQSNGLEGLGVMQKLGVNSSRFTGKNYRAGMNNFSDRFMLSNLLGSVSAIAFSSDNPRDDNIYLKYHYLKDVGFTKEHKPTFDWVIYEQTIWQAIHELTLFENNVFPIVKMYNTDIGSYLGDIRETIVIGNKSGYYKYNDSYNLSTMKVADLRESTKDWSNILRILTSSPNKYGTKQNLSGTWVPRKEISDDKYFPMTEINNATDASTSKQYITTHNGLLRGISNTTVPVFPVKSTYGADFLKLYNFFNNKRNVLVIIYKILKDVIKYKEEKNMLSSAMWQYLSTVLEPFIGNKNLYQPEGMLSVLYALLMMADNRVYTITDSIGTAYINTGGRGVTIANFDKKLAYMILLEIAGHFNKNILNSNMKDLNYEDYIHVEPALDDNTDVRLHSDPRYKRIQNHHLVTDYSDIIENGIVLSGDFANAVSVAFPREPKHSRSFRNLQDVQRSDFDKLQFFTVKSFGDLRDGDVRLLETFQKNIDTNWWDVKSTSEGIFKNFGRTHSSPENMTKFESDWNVFPSWVTVPINILQREAEKMYRGTIEIIGNPNIECMDIIHMQDNINDMHGVIEVEEVIHSFTPDAGYRTIITPNTHTYQRDPTKLVDVSIMNNIINTGERMRSTGRAWAMVISAASAVGLATSIATIVGSKGLLVKAGAGAVALTSLYMLATNLYYGTVGIEKRYSKFLFSHMANVFGRDCINFTSLMYKGMPYVAGYSGVDYTNLTTLINHQHNGTDTVTRIATANDIEYSWLVKHGDISNLSIMEQVLLNIPGFKGVLEQNFGNQSLSNFYGLFF